MNAACVPGHRLLALPDVAPVDVGSWRDLVAAASEPNPFHEPEVVIPAARLLGEQPVALLVVEDADGWLGCLPVKRMRWWRGLPVTLLASWRHPYCFLGTPLVRSGHEELAVTSLLEAALAQPGVALVALRWHSASGPVAAALARAGELLAVDAVPYARMERALLCRRPDNTYVSETLSSKHRREYRRLRALLAREAGAELVNVDRAGDPGAYRRFLALEAAGWKGRVGTALASRSGDSAFFEAVLSGFQRLGRLELLALEAGGATLAMKCNVGAGDGQFALKIAYDERYARFSPGIQLELEAVDTFHERRALAWFDSCADPENEMINRLWPDRRELVSLTVTSRDRRGRLVRRAAAAASAVRDVRTRRTSG